MPTPTVPVSVNHVLNIFILVWNEYHTKKKKNETHSERHRRDNSPERTMQDVNLVSTDNIRPNRDGDVKFGPCRFKKTSVFETGVSSDTGQPLRLLADQAIQLVSGNHTIDCNGSTFTNVAGIIVDPDLITFTTPYITTIGNVTTNALTYATVLNATYYVNIVIIAKDVASANTNWYMEDELSVVNAGGLVSFTVTEAQKRSAGPSVTLGRVYSTAGDSLVMDVVGENAVTARWKCFVRMYRNN